MDNYQEMIAITRYAKWLPEEGRRELWPETVDRYINFWVGRYEDKGILSGKVTEELRGAIKNLEVMPSMRCMMTAGEALERDNVAGFNCAYMPIDHPRAFDELVYILMCGTGDGYSVEREEIAKLPSIPEELKNSEKVIQVADSKVGWADAYRKLVSMLYSGEVPSWDTSKVRAAGVPLKTFGGRASGPEPLEQLFRLTIKTFKGAAGRKLTSIEASDICCYIADAIVVGGVRRSALICLSNLSDGRMAGAKNGDWRSQNSQRANMNSSAVYDGKPDFLAFMKEQVKMYESYAGERGIFNRQAAKKVAGFSGRRDTSYTFGTNPCSEIILRPNQFCNLSEVVIREADTLDDLKRKVKQATILGTLQATLTDFRYLRKIWKTNTEEEALLGVSLTGIMDHKVMSGGKDLKHWLNELKEVAIETNKTWAKKLGINQSTAITCVKPSGTVSQLTNSASGIHPRFSSHYIRRVRNDSKDPISTFMEEAGVPCELAYNPMSREYDESTKVFSFPQAAPKGAITTGDVKAMQQLALWKTYQEEWCEHKPSVTVYYKDDEFFEMNQFVWDNFDIMSGVAFLPFDGGIYNQAPYEAIDKEVYNKLCKAQPELKWDELKEDRDMTTSSQEFACVGNSCEWDGSK